MTRVIEVFVKNQKVLTESPCFVRAESGHPCAGARPGVTYEKKSVLAEPDKLALDIVRDIAGERELEVKVYNVSTTMGRLKARFRRVKKTPAVLIGDKRIDEKIEKDTILDALK